MSSSSTHLSVPPPPGVRVSPPPLANKFPPNNAPEVKGLDDLIKLGSGCVFYTNIDMNMLHRIMPHLLDLQKMIGLTKIKQSIFQMVIYFLQHLHMPEEESELYSPLNPVSYVEYVRTENLKLAEARRQIEEEERKRKAEEERKAEEKRWIEEEKKRKEEEKKRAEEYERRRAEAQKRKYSGKRGKRDREYEDREDFEDRSDPERTVKETPKKKSRTDKTTLPSKTVLFSDLGTIYNLNPLLQCCQSAVLPASPVTPVVYSPKEKGDFFHTIIAGPPGCLDPETEVLMYDGTLKKAKYIEVKDMLMGDNSSPRIVENIVSGTDDMYEIVPSKGRSYTVNSKHILTLMTSEPYIKYRKSRDTYCVIYFDNIKLKSKSFKTEEEAKVYLQTIEKHDLSVDISLSDYIRLPKSVKAKMYTYHTGVDYSPVDVPIDPYLLGFWLGDGSKNSTVITTADPEIVKYLESKVEKYGLTINKLSDKYGYIISNMDNSKNPMSTNGKKINPFLNFLKSTNLIGNKHIPHNYLINSRENRLQLLAGLLDSDGYNQGTGFEIIQKSERLATEIERLALSLGFMATFTKVQKYCMYKGEKKEGTYHRVNIFGNNLYEIPVILERKKIRMRLMNKRVTCQGFNVIHKGKGNFNGFQVDKNNRFLLGDYTVTHNCGKTQLSKIIGNIFCDLKIFKTKYPQTKFTLAHRDDFVGQYLGQSAPRTRAFLDKHRGGVVMIDEAYSLGDPTDKFCVEVMDTIVSYLSEHRDDICIIFVGYKDYLIDRLLPMNHGLKRRIPWIHEIDPYTSEELAQIFLLKIADLKWKCEVPLTKLTKLIDSHKTVFEFAGGDVENIVNLCKTTESVSSFSKDISHRRMITLPTVKVILEQKKKEHDTKKKLDMYT